MEIILDFKLNNINFFTKIFISINSFNIFILFIYNKNKKNKLNKGN